MVKRGPKNKVQKCPGTHAIPVKSKNDFLSEHTTLRWGGSTGSAASGSTEGKHKNYGQITDKRAVKRTTTKIVQTTNIPDCEQNNNNTRNHNHRNNHSNNSNRGQGAAHLWLKHGGGGRGSLL